MPELSRRAFTKSAINSLLTFALLETFSKLDIFANSVKPLMNRWLLDVDELSRELRGKKIAQVVWQKKLEELYSKIELPDLLKLVDFDRLTKNIEFYDDRANTVDVHFPNVEGLPDKLEYITRIFALSKGRAIVPHGHRNMVSGHLVIKGQMEVKHYERLHDEPQYLTIRPSIDKLSKEGEATTISDQKDNIHWLKAITETAFTLDVIVADLNPKYPTHIDFIDPIMVFEN